MRNLNYFITDRWIMITDDWIDHRPSWHVKLWCWMSLYVTSSFDVWWACDVDTQHCVWLCDMNDCLAAGNRDVISSSSVWLTWGARRVSSMVRPLTACAQWPELPPLAQLCASQSVSWQLNVDMLCNWRGTKASWYTRAQCGLSPCSLRQFLIPLCAAGWQH